MRHQHIIFSFLFIVSLLFHLLIVLKIFYPESYLSIPLTLGMLLSWLIASKTIKEDIVDDSDNIFQAIKNRTPAWIKYTFIFFVIYTISNFLLTLSVDHGNGWVDFNPGHNKLRGISGFWLLFYATGFLSTQLKPGKNGNQHNP